MKRIFPPLIWLLVACLPAGMAGRVEAGSVEFSTYYPAPFGIYDRLRLVPRPALTEPCDAGAFYYETGVGLRLCDEATQTWGGLGGVWTQSGNNIYPNDTATNPNLNVGIGTTVPDSPLHIEQNTVDRVKFALKNTHPTNKSAGIILGGPPNVSEGWIISNDFSQNGGNDFFIFDRTPATGGVRMFFNSNGNVGIGTTTPPVGLSAGPSLSIGPASEFQVGSSGSNYVVNLNTASASLRLGNLSSNKTGGIFHNQGVLEGSQLMIGENMASYNVPTTTALPSWYSVYNVSSSADQYYICRESNLGGGLTGCFLNIANTGNVGIGTASPAALLHVNTSADPGMILENLTSLGVSRFQIKAALDGSPQLDFQQGGTLKSLIGLVRVSNGSCPGSAVGDLCIRSENQKILFSSDSGLTSAMSILSNGNVGIGTAAPNQKLEVNGGIQSTGDGASITHRPSSSGPSTYANIQAASTGMTRLGLNDQVTPRRFDVFTGGTVDYLGGPFGGKFGIADVTAGSVVRFLIDSTGNVGIGTTAPTAKLHVIGKGTFTGGIDPPYISFSDESHESIRKYAKNVEKHEKVMQFWNGKTHRMEVYVIEEDRFYTITGELIEE